MITFFQFFSLDAYPVKHMNLRWFHDPGIKIDKKMMAQFEMTNFTTKLEIETYVAGLEIFCKLLSVFKTSKRIYKLGVLHKLSSHLIYSTLLYWRFL